MDDCRSRFSTVSTIPNKTPSSEWNQATIHVFLSLFWCCQYHCSFAWWAEASAITSSSKSSRQQMIQSETYPSSGNDCEKAKGMTNVFHLSRSPLGLPTTFVFDIRFAMELTCLRSVNGMFKLPVRWYYENFVSLEARKRSPCSHVLKARRNSCGISCGVTNIKRRLFHHHCILLCILSSLPRFLKRNSLLAMSLEVLTALKVCLLVAFESEISSSAKHAVVQQAQVNGNGNCSIALAMGGKGGKVAIS